MKIIDYVLVFALGFIACLLLSYLPIAKELPLSFGSAQNTEAPGNWIEESQIHVYKNALVLDLEGASLSSYADTGSMKPVLDKDSNGIRIVPKDEKSINVGDIVTFEQNGDLIVHRVIEKGEDEQGLYFITKGDSNDLDDGKIRFSDIKYVTIGVLY